MYHPVTTEFSSLQQKVKNLVSALMDSKKNYIVVYPNNDYGSEIILSEYKRFDNNEHFRVFPSIRFECFLTMLKNAEFMIGNSSAGIRETGVYGIPTIDLGSRQHGRYVLENSNIQHVNEDYTEILEAIGQIDRYGKINLSYGKGNSTEQFIEILRKNETWDFEIQKKFVDIHSTL
ncbi:MAG: UDP-N-acetylglucosamine 2-epimerase [Lachnospiraceae bacterium]|nr:UDP-N-acetylglucosamine 2-epimerase [Lachnospiraceae bacterium]